MGESLRLRNMGVLALPMASMIAIGFVGFRPRQLMGMIPGIMLNFIFLFNCTFSVAAAIFTLRSDVDYGRLVVTFAVGFYIMVVVKFICMVYLSYKPYNIVCLLKDVSRIRTGKIGTFSTIYIVAMFCGITSILVYILYLASLHALLGFVSGPWMAGMYTGPNVHLLRLFTILEWLVYATVSWSSLILTGFTTMVLSLVLSDEYQKIIDELQNKIQKNKGLTDDALSAFIGRFRAVTSVVRAVDEMLCVFVGVDLGVSLACTCAATYSMLVGDSFTSWNVPLTVSILTLLTVLPAVSNLNNKAHSVVDVLQESCTDNLSDRSLHQMHVFMTGLVHSPVGLSVGGMFLLTRDAVVTIMGTFMAYVILCVQSAGGGGCEGGATGNTTAGVPGVEVPGDGVPGGGVPGDVLNITNTSGFNTT